MPDFALHKSIVRQYAEALTAGDMEAMGRLFAPDAQIHSVLGAGGLDFAMGIWRDVHSAFKTELVVDELVAEGDLVAARFTENGTFNGAFRGVAPTGRSYSVTAMELFRIENGKITHRWGARDSATIGQQVGVAII